MCIHTALLYTCNRRGILIIRYVSCTAVNMHIIKLYVGSTLGTTFKQHLVLFYDTFSTLSASNSRINKR